MLKTKHNIIAIGILGIAIAIVIVVVGSISWGHRAAAPVTSPSGNNPSVTATSTATSTAARKYTPHPPHGPVTYQIAEAATQLPGFVQATIDPVDVSVGQIQHFTIVTNDPNPVTSVVAVITTDHKTITVPLVSQGVPATSMLVPRTVIVGSDNRLALVSPGAPGAGGFAAANTETGAHIANAATANDTEFTGQWTVEDTHTAKYQTVFTAKDSAGNENSVTLQWTDPCPFVNTNNYGGGNVTISGDCEMASYVSGLSAVDGPELGHLVVAATMTIDPGATLVINNGYDIKFSGSGKILMVSTASQIVFGKDMCGQDNDGDHYIAGSSWSTSCGGKVSRASLSGGGFGDCNDGNANVYPGQTGYFSTPTLTDLGPNTYDYNCDGVATPQEIDQVQCILYAPDRCDDYSCNAAPGSPVSLSAASCGTTIGYDGSCYSTGQDCTCDVQSQQATVYCQ